MGIDDQRILTGLMKLDQPNTRRNDVYKGSLPAGEGGLYGVEALSMSMRKPINARKSAKTDQCENYKTCEN